MTLIQELGLSMGNPSGAPHLQAASNLLKAQLLLSDNSQHKATLRLADSRRRGRLQPVTRGRHRWVITVHMFPPRCSMR